MNWNAQQRLRAIEIIVYWHERLNTTDLIDAFGISRIQASKDIKKYLECFPSNISYDLSEKSYIKLDSFKLCLTTGCLDEYIDHTSRMQKRCAHSVSEHITHHYRKAKPTIVSALLRAIREEKSVSINYASMQSPLGGNRIIHPHSIIDSGFRWHVRAYCENHHEFRDFNIGRIVGKPRSLERDLGSVHQEDDSLWNEIIDIFLIPNPSLSKDRQHLIANEFDMTQGKLCIPTRACLVHYLLQLYQIATENLTNPLTTQLLVIENVEMISKYLW